MENRRAGRVDFYVQNRRRVLITGRLTIIRQLADDSRIFLITDVFQDRITERMQCFFRRIRSNFISDTDRGIGDYNRNVESCTELRTNRLTVQRLRFFMGITVGTRLSFISIRIDYSQTVDTVLVDFVRLS